MKGGITWCDCMDAREKVNLAQLSSLLTKSGEDDPFALMLNCSDVATTTDGVPVGPSNLHYSYTNGDGPERRLNGV